MIHDLLGTEYLDNSILQLIQDTRKEFLENGGNPLEFGEYLKSQGLSTMKNFLIINDEFLMMAKLKFG